MFQLLKNLRSSIGMILFVIVLTFLRAITELFLPTMMGNIVDNGVVVGDIPYIWKTGSWMIGIAALAIVVSVTASYFSSTVAMGFGRDLRQKVFTHIQQYSLQEFNQIGTASLITRTTNDITQLQQVVVMMLRMVIMAPLMFIGGIIMAISKDAKLSSIILLILPVLIGTMLIILKKGMPLFRAIQKKLDRLNLVMRENLTGIRVIRAFNRDEDERKRLQSANKDLTNVSIRVNQLMAFAMPSVMLLMNIAIILIIWFGGLRIDSGGMQIGDLMAFIQYIMQILFAFIMASIMFIMIPRASVSAKRIQEVLLLQPSIVDEGNKKADVQKGLLQFENVTFTYPGAEEPALQQINFTAKPGEITAIIGGTGSGKSTLIHLIPRFYEVSEGTIRVNGVDIRKAPQKEIRSKIGFVPQKALLFSGTIKENIRYGKEDATDEEIKHAAKIAQADEFIEQLEDGYESEVEQGGTNLSGGQKQRLSIARAIVRKPDIYLFDDSFSALDYKTDARLRRALREETKEATVIIVAQRVSSIMDADQIIVLDQGKIAGIGTHLELLESNKVYQEIVRSQLGRDEIA